VSAFADPATARAAVPRDRYGRPLIIPPGGGEPVAYTRVSTFASALDDKSSLADWTSAMTLIGAAKDETLVRGARGLNYQRDKSRVRELVEQAKVLGGANNARDEGTTLHGLTEKLDAGHELPDLDAQTIADLDAYRRITAGLTPVLSETFVVNDELQVAGTFDRLLDISADKALPPWLHGRRVIGDLKTGGVDYKIGSFALQLACYARGQLYDPVTGQRTPLGADESIGLVVHLPQRTGRAAIYAIDLTRGYAAAGLARAVREWRTTARLSTRNYDSLVAKEIASC
jgi:hypothetical protein